jgi:hypothetical protein
MDWRYPYACLTNERIKTQLIEGFFQGYVVAMSVKPKLSDSLLNCSSDHSLLRAVGRTEEV